MSFRPNLNPALLGSQPLISYDLSAKTYIDAVQTAQSAGLPFAHRKALNKLVLGMKGLDPVFSNYGNPAIWNAGILFCPNLGSSLATTKFNLFNPLDTDAAKRQVYIGGVTYDKGFGVKGNGIDGRIRTFVSQKYDAGLNPTSATIGTVYKNNSLVGRMDFGCYGSSTASDANLWLRIINGGAVSIMCRNYTYEGSALTTPTTQAGHWCLKNGSAPNKPQLYYNKVKIFEHSGTPNYNYLDESREFTASGANGELSFLALNYNQGTFVNFCSNTLILYYVMKNIDPFINDWNTMIETFCIETGRGA